MIHDKWRMVLLQYQSAKAEWISFSYKRDNLKVVEVTSKSFDLVTSHSHLPAPPPLESYAHLRNLCRFPAPSQLGVLYSDLDKPSLTERVQWESEIFKIMYRKSGTRTRNAQICF